MLRAQGFDLDKIAEWVGELLDMEVGDAWAEGKHRKVVKARSLFCYWAV
jgi:chromosomal replication initiation ATPase DnaA